MRWTDNWKTKDNCKLIQVGVSGDFQWSPTGPWGSVLGPVLTNIFIIDLDAGIEKFLSKSANNMKFGRTANTLEEGSTTQQDLDRMES